MTVESDANGRHLPAGLRDALSSVGIDPAMARVTRRPSGTPGAAFLALPSLAAPRLLVPFGKAGAKVVRERGSQGAARKAMGQILATALASGAMAVLPTRRLEVSDPVLKSLAAWLADDESGGVRLGILLGPARANRKAVVRVFNETGDTVGFGKVGATQLTRKLVRDEARHLEELAADPPRQFRIPAVKRFRDDGELVVLVTSPLAVGAVARRPLGLPVSETRELFCRNEVRGVTVGELPFMGPTDVSDQVPDGRTLESMRERLLRATSSLRLTVGDSHGDWAPQNMALGPEGLDVWDWERYSTRIPQGFDVLHFLARQVDASPGRLAGTEAKFLREAPDSLAQCGIDPALTQPLIALYLFWVGRRYAADCALVASVETETRLRWVAGRLETQVSDLESRERRG